MKTENEIQEAVKKLRKEIKQLKSNVTELKEWTAIIRKQNKLSALLWVLEEEKEK